MAQRVCPWWFGYFLASPLRRLRQNPNAILREHVTKGMVVLEPGPGMGFFTLEMARLAGSSGKVIAVDVQQKMLRRLAKRATRAKLNDRIETRPVSAKGLGVNDLRGKVDFVLAFAMVHEVPSQELFFKETAASLKSKGRMLFGEPKGHVSAETFGESLKLAAHEGLVEVRRLEIPGTIAALLEKRGAAATATKRPAERPTVRKPAKKVLKKPAAKRPATRKR